MIMNPRESGDLVHFITLEFKYFRALFFVWIKLAAFMVSVNYIDFTLF